MPVYVPGTTPDGLGIYTGVVNAIQNLVIHVTDSKLGVVGPRAQQYFYYDGEMNEILDRNSGGTQFASAIINGAGLQESLEVGQKLTIDNVDWRTIRFKIVPA